MIKDVSECVKKIIQEKHINLGCHPVKKRDELLPMKN